MAMQPQPELTPQQEAIREVRTRYERGEIPFEAFEQAFDALLKTQSPEECRAIVAQLPTTPATVLDALTPAPAPPAPRPSRLKWLVAIMGSVMRTRQPWRLAARTVGIAIMGSIHLDLALAALPQQSQLWLFALMGSARIYVPRSLHVTVRGLSAMGGIRALGKHDGGLISFCDEESEAQGVSAPAAHLDIFAITIMGGIDVVPIDGPMIAGGVPVTDRALLDRYDRRLLRQERRMRRREYRW